MRVAPRVLARVARAVADRVLGVLVECLRVRVPRDHAEQGVGERVGHEVIGVGVVHVRAGAPDAARAAPRILTEVEPHRLGALRLERVAPLLGRLERRGIVRADGFDVGGVRHPFHLAVRASCWSVLGFVMDAVL